LVPWEGDRGRQCTQGDDHELTQKAAWKALAVDPS
jgi:hypothetical protein